MSVHADKIRIDKWLWHARFFKTRSLAAKQVGAGHVRVNGAKVLKPSQNVTVEDVLTFSQGHQVRVVRIVSLSERRGPATEAQTLYFDMTEPQEKSPANPKFEGKGRPDKRSRRALGLTRIWEDH
ncbi:RNA-binding S4 domain-containing protein [Phaeobacter sp. B1627]|uniref:RNA-binding S4 domain-containing protein n=1 Tax=Phaeobacter sp. B1627 TaxID=2583809 RepID=UPI0011180B74|nr:RNA-binding S4 domain-containing protein [Phaeobacter sp. B1627]TNJ41768.1 RNA-binding S4 domain-containing protein [Phaeobacter sp. B1627]